MRKLLLTTAGLILASGAAMAGITSGQLAAAYQAQGYTAIEITTGPHQIKVDAVLNRTKVEAVYDIATGAIVSQEHARASGATGASVIKVKTEAADFTEIAAPDDQTDPAELSDGQDDHGKDTAGTGTSSGGTKGQAMTDHQSGENSADQADASHTSSSGGGSADGEGSHSGGNTQSHD